MKKIFYPLYLFFLFLLFQSPAIGQPFTLVRDINLGPEYDPPRPLNLTEAGGFLYFNISSGSAAGLWKTDGSETATVMLKSISAGENIEDIAEVNDIIFFLINNTASSSTSLWKSDGSIAGTTIIQSWSNSKVSDLTGANGILYFTVLNLSTYNSELFKSDGTEAGTTLITSGTYITNLIDVNGILFFIAANNTVPYYRLWKTDGTVPGTNLVKDIYSGGENPYFETFFNANGTLFFVANDRVNGEELWKSDGTETGTVLIKDIQTGAEGSNIHSFVMLGSTVYFFATSVSNGPGLWKSDGTSGGTNIITSFTGEPNYLTNVNGVLFFAGHDDIHGVELWKSNGTEAGTTIVKDINPGTDPNFTNSSNPASLFNANGTLYFTAFNGSNNQIWKSDGTETGTVGIKGGYRGVLYPSTTIQFVMASGIAYFAAFEEQYGFELWKTNGTTNGTTLVKNISPSPNGSPQKFVTANGLVYFSVINYVNAPGPAEGRDIYHTDGTFSGTSRAEHINGRYHSNPLDMINHNGVLFISGSNSHNNAFDGYELYKISSAGERQVRVKDINPLFNQIGSEPHNFQSVNQFLYFSANDASTGFELWKSDGTEGGTVLVKDINPSGDSDPRNLVNVNGVLYFVADDGTNGIELWKSDGTEGGTVLVKNINASGSSNPSFLTNINGILYFSADDGVNGVEVWKSDGTNAGTVLIKDIYSGSGSSNPALFTNLNGIALFAADDGVTGRELWGSNGTFVGTVLIKDIRQGAVGSNPSILTRVGSNVLFAADDGVRGKEVWLSNSAEQGTRLMSEIEPGINGSDPTEIFEYGAKVLVAATNAMVGSEVWIADVPAGGPLPLELLEFKGSVVNSDGLLQWKTDNETNTSSFIVERSIDGRNYKTIGSVAAANSPGIHYYDFTDINITSLGLTTIYYRLRQTDIDGRYTYSNIVVLSIVNNKFVVRLYPNPAKDRLNMTINISQTEKLQWQLLDHTGRVIKNGAYNLSGGSTAVSIDLAGLSSGIYLMQLNGPTLQQVIKVIKQ
jgi:trimeric autotransporter adhesin